MTHTTTPVPVRQEPTAAPPSRDPRVFLGWALLAAGLAAAGVLILAVTSSGPAPQPATTPSPTSSLFDAPNSYAGWPAGVPRSADAAERWFAQEQATAGWPAGVPRSADAAERWFAQQQATAGWPAGVPRSADAAERWFARP
jgi:hypothetical protein